MRQKLDCLAYEALDPEAHFTRLSNADYLAFLRENLWERLTSDQRELFEKLLARDRSRFVSTGDLRALLSEDHEARYAHYKNRLEHYSIQCVQELLSKAMVPPDRIRLIITTTTVSGVCPPLSSVIAHELNLPSSTQAIDLGYMGCSAAIWGGELASRLLRPGEVALILSAELTSAMSNFRGGPESLAACSVFGDGVGAFLVAAPPHPYPARFHVHGFGGSLICSDQAMDCIRYEANPVFHEIRLKDTIPEVAAQGIEATLRPLVRRHLVTGRQKLRYLVSKSMPRWQENVDYLVLHAAGNKILTGLRERLGLSERQVAHNFSNFNKYGNTSSSSIFYGLKELEASRPLKRGERLLFLAYGSGFMTKGMYATVA